MRRAAELFDAGGRAARRARTSPAYDEARQRGDIRAAVARTRPFHFALYEAARSGWLLRADPPGVGLAASATGRCCSRRARCRTGTRSSTSSCSRRAPPAMPDRALQLARCTTTSSSRRTSTTPSSSTGRASHLRVLGASPCSEAPRAAVARPRALREAAARSELAARRACPSRRRGRGRARCSRRCARAARPASRARAARERPPEEVLVERERAAVRIAVPEVDVHRARGRRARARRAGAGSTRGSGCAARAAPGSGRRTAPAAASDQTPSPTSSSPAASPLTCHGSSCSWIQSIPLPVGRARRIDRQRLADDDRRLGRQQAALRLVHRARDAVEPGRDVHDRRLGRAARRRRQRAGSESAKWICISARP